MGLAGGRAQTGGVCGRVGLWLFVGTELRIDVYLCAVFAESRVVGEVRSPFSTLVRSDVWQWSFCCPRNFTR